MIIFFLLKTFWLEYQIMNSNIIPHNNNTTKSWMLIFVMAILQLQSFKTQITTNTRAVVDNGLFGFVAERISQTAFNMPSLSWEEFESREDQIFHVASQP